ncbi:MAG: hypothetical protein R3B47_19760 [Bacteroidia bacterium]
MFEKVSRQKSISLTIVLFFDLEIEFELALELFQAAILINEKAQPAG